MDLFLCQIFDQIDTDKSGTLSVDEIKAAMVCLLGNAWDLDTLFDAMDVDKNGEVSLEEFKSFLQRDKYVFAAMTKKMNDQGLISGLWRWKKYIFIYVYTYGIRSNFNVHWLCLDYQKLNWFCRENIFNEYALQIKPFMSEYQGNGKNGGGVPFNCFLNASIVILWL